MTKHEHGSLKNTFRRALVILHGGNLVREHDFWRRHDGMAVNIKTIEALYDRALVKIVVESRHRKIHTAKLTEIGACVARDLVRARREEVVEIDDCRIVYEGRHEEEGLAL